MATYVLPNGSPVTSYNSSSGNHFSSGNSGGTITLDDGNGANTEFDTSENIVFDIETLATFNSNYVGTVNVGGTLYPTFAGANGFTYVLGISLDSMTYPTVASLSLNTANFTVCFATGTLICVPGGETAVEHLSIGDTVVAQDGREVPIRWIGRQTIMKKFFGTRAEMVRIKTGALGCGLPHTDLTVTSDHGMVIDGVVINASALVNGTTIAWVPLSETANQYTVYHIETEEHDVIFANGAPAETFLDIPDRKAFDNYSEYQDLYGQELEIAENPMPRISSARLLPASLRESIQAVAFESKGFMKVG